MINTAPFASEKSSASRSLRAPRRRTIRSVRVAKGGPSSSVMAAIADSRLPCVALSRPSDVAERHQHEGELARAGEHRARPQRLAALGAGDAEQRPHDAGFQQR